MSVVLIVDDSKTSRKILKNIIAKMGYDILEAENGEEGVKTYREAKPDLILLDVTMPVMDGIDALKLILDEDPQARVVMVSAAAQKSTVLTAIRYGAREFITKPYEEEDIRQVIREVMDSEDEFV